MTSRTSRQYKPIISPQPHWAGPIPAFFPGFVEKLGKMWQRVRQHS